ncbi:MAG: MATE family efflux transporter [Lachnospiraceae bacterium]|nr:MATE family efflux transporter [Lachnospiraceae bacterium]
MKSNITDMTQGSPTGHLLLFSLPMMIGNIFQQAYNLADSIIVGRFVGADAFAAVGATGSICFLFFALCNGLGGGGGIVVSQYYGAHDDDNVKRCVVNTGFIMLLTPILFGVVGFLLAPQLLKLLSTPATILADAVSYTRYMCVGLLFVSLYNYVSSMMRALGDSKTPLYFLIFSTFLNIVLDVVLVVYLSMGITGAALATILSQLVSVILCGVFAYFTNPYFKPEKRLLSLSGHMCYKIIRLGVPMSLQFGLIAISSMAVQRVVNSFGTVVVAAFTATNRIEQLIHQPYTTLSAALSTYCGQNFGANRKDRVYSGYRAALRIMLILTVVLILGMQFFGKAITGLFVEDEAVVALGALGLRICSLFYFALGLIYVVRGILTGIGDAFFQLFNGLIEVIGRFTLPILFTSYLGFGQTGIWLSAGVVWVLSGATAWMRYHSYFRKKLKPEDLIPPGSEVSPLNF